MLWEAQVRLYTINVSSGVATAVGRGPFSTALSGTEFRFNFNPLADPVRIVSNTGKGLRLNPMDEVVNVDGSLNPASKGTTAAA